MLTPKQQAKKLLKLYKEKYALLEARGNQLDYVGDEKNVAWVYWGKVLNEINKLKGGKK